MEPTSPTLPEALITCAKMFVEEHQRTNVSFGEGMLWIWGTLLFVTVLIVGGAFLHKEFNWFRFLD